MGLVDVQATERLAAGSVYFVRFGNGEAGSEGVSCAMLGCGVAVSIVDDVFVVCQNGGL